MSPMPGNSIWQAAQEPEHGVRHLRPLQDFLRTEAFSGLLLMVAVVVALIWANSPWSASYEQLWSTPISLRIGSFELALDLRHWINEGLMTLFFFVIGLEIKRELIKGELRDPRRAALPAIAALGGMAVPALIFFAFNPSGEASHGWAIPMATDIAIALGLLSLLGNRVPVGIKIFLLTLAIVDDIGAIVVIAIFYSTNTVDLVHLMQAAALLILAPLLRAMRFRWIPLYAVLAVASWLAVYFAGIHATLAGVILGILTPAQPLRRPEYVDVDELTDLSDFEAAHKTAVLARQSVSSVEWLEHRLHPWVSYAVMPLFALANAGIVLSATSMNDALTSSVTLGIVAGLVGGKILGISVFSLGALRLGIGSLPTGVTRRQLLSVSALAGVGFTISIFVADLAFQDQALNTEAKSGVLIASLVAGLLGLVLLRLTCKPHQNDQTES